MKIPRSRSTISWEFSVKSHDIGFAVLHEPENEEEEDDDDDEEQEKEVCINQDIFLFPFNDGGTNIPFLA